MSHKATVRCAVVQTLAELGDVSANIGLLRSFTQEAVEAGAELIVFPECMNTGYLFDDEAHCRSLAEGLDGAFVTAMKDLSRQHHVYIVSGITEMGANGTIFNSAVMTDRAGNVAATYRKQFLATHDQNWFSAGDQGCVTVSTDLGVIGILICFDGRIPEIARETALAGAQIIVDVANFFEIDQAEQWVPARAYENGVWMVASTKCGVERSIFYPGGSLIAGPDGRVHAQVPRGVHGIAVYDVEPAAASDKRWLNGGDRFADRRPELYGALAQNCPVTGAAQPSAQNPVYAAAVQSHNRGSTASLEKAVELVEDTARLGVKLITLPQHFAMPTHDPDAATVTDWAEAQNRALERIRTICVEYSAVAVVPRTFVIDEHIAQEAVVVGPDGTTLAVVQQSHCVSADVPARSLAQGLTPVKTPVGRLGVLIGYDGMFPETARALALRGAEVLVWCAAWSTPQERRLLAVTKAEDNRCFLMAANRSDAGSPGGSLIVPPTGLPGWDVDEQLPPSVRHGHLAAGYLNLAMAQEKTIIPKVDVFQNRIPAHYPHLVAL